MSSNSPQDINAEQHAFWNGEAGLKWARYTAQMEQSLLPIAEATLARAQPQAGEKALDIGCGCGSQSFMLADAVGDSGEVLAVDISAPMLAVAQQRLAERNDQRSAALRFELADASNYPFLSAHYDLLFSRFGVMFFEQPVPTFAHLNQALRPGGRLSFCCWQALSENRWVVEPMAAVLAHVAPPPPMPEGTPGPFAFANPDYIRAILSEAGFSEIVIEPLELELRFGEAPTLEESAEFLMQMGPASRLLYDLDQHSQQQIRQTMAERLAPFYRGAICLPGKIWIVSALK